MDDFLYPREGTETGHVGHHKNAAFGIFFIPARGRKLYFVKIFSRPYLDFLYPREGTETILPRTQTHTYA